MAAKKLRVEQLDILGMLRTFSSTGLSVQEILVQAGGVGLAITKERIQEILREFARLHLVTYEMVGAEYRYYLSEKGAKRIDG